MPALWNRAGIFNAPAKKPDGAVDFLHGAVENAVGNVDNIAYNRRKGQESCRKLFDFFVNILIFIDNPPCFFAKSKIQ